MKKIKKIEKLKTDIYADGANLKEFINLNKLSYIKGFTTNPSLLKKNKVKNYKNFAKNLLNIIKKKPVSFEVFADELNEMETQANEISKWGKNVYVKIPITNTKGKYTCDIIKKLSHKTLFNVTAIFTKEQVKKILSSIDHKTKIILSIFAGRIADTGVDPVEFMKDIIRLKKKYKNVKILWASTRELYNIFEAEKIRCDIITVPTSILKKTKLINKNLNSYSLETVKDFYEDAKSTKFTI